MNTLIFQTDKMGTITITNNSSEDIYVSVTATGGDAGDESWFPLRAYGGSDSWGRNKYQVIRFTRSQSPGILVETVLGVPGKTTNIY